MAEKKLMALDVGSSWVRAVIGSVSREGQLMVDTVCERPSEGVVHGRIVNIEQCLRTISSVVQESELQAGTEVDSVIFGVGGSQIETYNSEGVVGITGKDLEITRDDIYRSLEVAKAFNLPADREILHTLVQDFCVDGKDGIKDPVDMLGHRLETKVLIVTGHSDVIQNERKTLIRAGFDSQRVILQSLADAEVVLSAEEKEIGTVLVNIGSQVTNMIAYSNGSPCYAGGIDLGSNDVTKDIAYILGKSHAVAESVKCESGCCYIPQVNQSDMVVIPQVQGLRSISMPKRELCKIIEPRMAEIFSFLKNDLDKCCPQAQFSSGVVLVGGGALLSGVSELASEIFRLQPRIGFPEALHGLDRSFIDPKYTTVLGLLQNESARYLSSALGKKSSKSSGGEWKQQSSDGLFKKISRFFRTVAK
ncbi:MAG: cell division protein FtsA [Sphaerochaetaceae bacterium]|nr:cell division protein FtsA [Sphaerochaetaceae bacterium]MDD4396886.1 cell division protein FtsA [Sphaerochaetaceae bacterium]